MKTARLHRCAMLALCALLLCTAAVAQQPPQGPPPSVANEPPPEPGADELNTAARKGDVASVKALLDKGISPDAKWRYGMTALFPAAERGHIEVVKLLLERGANVNAADRFYNFTPIFHAVDKGHVEIVVLLLEKGARPSPQTLNMGVEKGHAGLVRASVAKGGLPPFALTAALVRATRENKSEIVQILTEGGAKPALALSAEALAKYTGSFRAAEDPDLLVLAVKDGGIEVTSGSQKFNLFAETEDTFRPMEFPQVVLKAVKEGEAINSISIVQGPRTINYKRVEVKQ